MRQMLWLRRGWRRRQAAAGGRIDGDIVDWAAEVISPIQAFIEVVGGGRPQPADALVDNHLAFVERTLALGGDIRSSRVEQADRAGVGIATRLCRLNIGDSDSLRGPIRATIP